MSHATLPLFPLNTVLFPGGPLSLRIFEPRYLDLVRRCLKESSPFGVVLILAGAEAGGEVTAMAELGTSARLVDFDTLPDGLLGVTAVGERRFRVRRRWQESDGLHVAELDYLPSDALSSLPEPLGHLSELLRQVLPKIGGGYTHIDTHFEDAGWVSNRWAEILPLSVAERLQLLQTDDPVARLERVAIWSEREPPAAGV